MTNRTTDLRRLGAIVLAIVLCSIFGPASAAEVQSLSWGTSADNKPVLQIKVSGGGAYSTQTLEDGQRLRITFPDSTAAATLVELPAQGLVKGVYPYLAENGSAVNVDLLLSAPGQLQVEKAPDGYRVTVQAAEAKPAPAAATEVAPTPAASAAAPSGNAIEDIRYAKLPGDRVQITLSMSQPPPEPSSFTIANPARLSLDFPNTRVAVKKPSLQVKEGAVNSITAVQGENRARVVLNLLKLVGYTTSTDGNNFVITVNSLATMPTAGAEQPKLTHFAGTPIAGKYSIKKIDFRRGAQGDGKVVVTLSDPNVGIDIREQTGQILVDFLNTSLPAELQRRLDVVDFATPVQTVDTYTQGRNVRMVIMPKGKYEQVAYQAGNVFTVSVKPVVEKTAAEKKAEGGYTGEKLSLNFQNIDVRAALQVLADFTGLNFVVSDTVKGNLTLRLKDVPWDQALDIIVNAKDLAVRRNGNVVIVAPAAEVAAKEKAAYEASKAAQDLEPLVSELIQLNYAKADDIAALIKSIKPVVTPGQQHPVFGSAATGGGVQATTESNTLLSPRGQVTVDKRTNSILVQDTPQKVAELRKLIAKLDRPVRQVMVETRLVEATDNYAKNLGARLAHYSIQQHGATQAVTSGNLSQLPSLFPAGGGTPVYQVTPAGLSVDLAAAGVGGFSAGSFMVALMRGSNELDLELSALEQSGQGKIISSPRIITGDQQQASIEQGQEQVFTTSVLGVGSVITKKATLKLDVTPQITPDDRVNLAVDITKDDFQNATSGLLNIKEIKTQVLLDNGETVVIGGIYENDKNKTVTKVPFFGDLPLLGVLFRNKAEFDNKTELLIFLTPKILSERLSLQ